MDCIQFLWIRKFTLHNPGRNPGRSRFSKWVRATACQNEPEIISTTDKLALIGNMIDAGVRRMEVASFVHPGRVPQMADAEAVIEGLPDRKDMSYIGLCLNKRGVLRGLATREGNKRGIDEAGCVVVASDTFGEKIRARPLNRGFVKTGR